MRAVKRYPAAESDCDYHVQISPQPRTTTNKPSASDDCVIVEIPRPDMTSDPALRERLQETRDWIVKKLLKGEEPKTGSEHVMVHPVYVTVTGAIFYDDAHVKTDGTPELRGKKGMHSHTLWELHPVTRMAFAPKPH